MFVTIPVCFSTIAKTIRCCYKLWFCGVSIVTRRDLQRSIVICLHLAIYCKSWWYTLQRYLRMDSVQMIENKDGFLRLIVFTIVKITSTNKEIDCIVCTAATAMGTSTTALGIGTEKNPFCHHLCHLRGCSNSCHRRGKICHKRSKDYLARGAGSSAHSAVFFPLVGWGACPTYPVRSRGGGGHDMMVVLDGCEGLVVRVWFWELCGLVKCVTSPYNTCCFVSLRHTSAPKHWQTMAYQGSPESS